MTEFESGVQAVETWLSMLNCRVERLERERIVALYPDPLRNLAVGWRLEEAIAGGTLKLDLLLPIGFPYQPPRVALVDAPPFLTWPHVEKDNVLCLAPNTLEIDPSKPVGSVAEMLRAAITLVDDLLAGRCDDDFRDEFLSYWDRASNSDRRIVSLLKAQPPSRQVHLWKGVSYYVLAETADEIRSWLVNRSGKAPETFATSAEAFIWIGVAPTPQNYPSSGSSLRALFAKYDPSANNLLARLAHGEPDKIVLAMGVDTKNGAALAGMIVPAPQATKYGVRDPVNKGFRPGSVPDGILMARYFGGQSIMRKTIERADAAWIHGRGQDVRADRLRGKTVALFGCGSLGGPLAVSLAQAGVGRIVMIDFDSIRWANIGRHPLGAGYVDQGKAVGLAEKLRADFPHSTFDYFNLDVDEIVRKHPQILASADLIVAATGSWAAEARLDAWHASTDRTVPILYTWMEPHAIAGHALLLAGRDHALGDCFDGTGRPDFQVVDWPSGSQTRQEPSCGAVYQPYGPVELGFVSSLAADLALETLVDDVRKPTYRLWIACEKRLSELGGSWSPAWQSDPQFRQTGGFIAERAWRAQSRAQAA